MKKLFAALGLISSLIQITPALANSMDVPRDCGLEPSVFSHNPNNITSAIDAGSAIYQNEADYLDWAGLFAAAASTYSSSTMSTVGPDHVLQGVPTRFKYDGSWFDWSSRWFTVRFGTSEFGSEVSTTSNIDNNAYKYLTFHYTHGPGLVWSRGDGCMTKSVMVQKAPKITTTSLSGGPLNISATTNATLDYYSKNSLSGVGQSVTFTYFNTDMNITYTKTVSGSSAIFKPQTNGVYDVSASVSDGNFSTQVSLGTVLYNGGAGCSSCGNKN